MTYKSDGKIDTSKLGTNVGDADDTFYVVLPETVVTNRHTKEELDFWNRLNEKYWGHYIEDFETDTYIFEDPKIRLSFQNEIKGTFLEKEIHTKLEKFNNVPSKIKNEYKTYQKQMDVIKKYDNNLVETKEGTTYVFKTEKERKQFDKDMESVGLENTALVKVEKPPVYELIDGQYVHKTEGSDYGYTSDGGVYYNSNNKNTSSSNSVNNVPDNTPSKPKENPIIEFGQNLAIDTISFLSGTAGAISEDLTYGTFKPTKIDRPSYWIGSAIGHVVTTIGGGIGTGAGGLLAGGGAVATPETGGASLGVSYLGVGIAGYSSGVAVNGVKGVGESIVNLVNSNNTPSSSGSHTNNNEKNSNTDNKNPQNNSKQNHDSGITNSTNSTAFTSNRNVSASKIADNGVKLDVPKDLTSQINDIAKKGDLQGFKTEEVVNEILKRDPNVELLDGGKYGSNNGFDHVFRNKKTGEVWVLDSKQIAKSGNMSVSNKGAGGTRQMSPDWVKNVSSKLDKNNPVKKAVDEAIDNGKINTGLVGVDKKTGELIFIPTKIINIKK
jgi:hypothetical protein